MTFCEVRTEGFFELLVAVSMTLLLTEFMSARVLDVDALCRNITIRRCASQRGILRFGKISSNAAA